MMQQYRKGLFLFLFSVLFLMQAAFGQTGNWAPQNADLSYPRTLLKASELTTVQNNLTNPELYSLYQGIYADAYTTPPAATTARDDRRASARIAKNAAFVLLLDRKPIAGATQPLTSTEKQDLTTKIVSLLENLNPAVEVFAVVTPIATPPYFQVTTYYEEWQWRTKELIDYTIAYDLLKGTGTTAVLSTSQSKIQQFAGNLYLESHRVVSGQTFYANVKNNHTLMTTAALGLAAVVLNDATSTLAEQQPQNWINAAMYHTDNVLWKDTKRQSEPGKIAGYAEGPYYFKYAFYNCLPFFRAMGNFLPNQTDVYRWNTASVTLRNPYFDTNYDNLYEWATTIMLPDGRLPALEDSYIDMGMPELMLTGKPQYVTPMDFSKFSSGQLASLDAQLNTTVDLRAAYIAAYQTPNPEIQPALTALPESGNLIFRSGNTASDNYLHVYGKNGNSLLNSGGHNHGDAGSFQLYGKGQLLALDPGYIGYSSRSQVGNATNHNLVLVDNAGPAIGSPGAPNDAQAYIQNTFASGNLSYGEVQTSYQNASITRKTISIRNEFYIVADFITAAAAHNYTWQLHGYGLENGTTNEGTFTDDLVNGKGFWTKNGVSLQTHVTATDGLSGLSKTTAVHELSAGTTQNHTALLAAKNSVANTQFLAMLQPYTTTPATVQSLNQTGLAGLTVTQNSVTDLIFTQTTSASASVASVFPQTITSNALLTNYSSDAVTGFRSLLIQGGDYLDYGSVRLVQSDVLADIALEKTGTETYEGYVNQAATVLFAVTGTPANVTGTNISSWQYNAAAKNLSITFSGPGNFSYKDQANVLPVTLIEFKAQRSNPTTVKLTWSTATETNNHGFEILKKKAENDVFVKVGFVKGKGNTTAVSVYAFEDNFAAEAAYYQLRQLDFDGGATLSPVVFAAGGKTLAADLQLWPLPASEELHIQPTGLSENNTFELILVNASGRKIHQQSFKNNLKLDVSRFTPGLYFLQLLDPETNLKLSRKVMIGKN